MNYLIKTGAFSLVGPPIILEHKRCCFDSDNLLRCMKMVKCLPEFEYFYGVLEK